MRDNEISFFRRILFFSLAGLCEVLSAKGIDKLSEMMPSFVSTAQRVELPACVRDGFLQLFIYLPITFEDDFIAYVADIIPPILKVRKRRKLEGGPPPNRLSTIGISRRIGVRQGDVASRRTRHRDAIRGDGGRRISTRTGERPVERQLAHTIQFRSAPRRLALSHNGRHGQNERPRRRGRQFWYGDEHAGDRRRARR